MMTLRSQDLPLPAGALFMCPGVDPTGKSVLSAARPEEASKMKRLIDAYLDGHPGDDPVVNPLFADLTGFPPLLVQAATGDIVLDESRQLAERAVAHGVDARLEIYAADTHVFHVFWSFLPEAADALQQAGAFIRARLGTESAAAQA
jgi:acetyl esterase/lipase